MCVPVLITTRMCLVLGLPGEPTGNNQHKNGLLIGDPDNNQFTSI